jgi:hypothetical protein
MLRKVSSLMLVISAVLAGATSWVPPAGSARAEEEPVFVIEFNDGKVTPQRLEVPANRRFKIELRNSGASPAEFESNELRKEKVLAPNSTSFLVIRTLDPGEYPFFDDFHPEAPPAMLVAK